MKDALLLYAKGMAMGAADVVPGVSGGTVAFITGIYDELLRSISAVPYAIRLAEACAELDIYWWEEVLHPDDVEGYALLKQAHPKLKWTTGEHEYTRYGFRRLIEGRHVDVLQPDVMWVGGLSALLGIAAQAAAYDIPVIPHGSGPYSYHFIASQPQPALCEYVAASPDGRSIRPIFGALFEGEAVPDGGRLQMGTAPGFGMELADRSMLADAASGLG